jgi:hypothetical protein
MKTVKSGNFWIGVIVGVVVVPFVMARFAPALKAKIPGHSAGPAAA